MVDISTSVFKDQATVEWGVAQFNGGTGKHEIVYRASTLQVAEEVLERYRTHAPETQPVVVQRSLFETSFSEYLGG